ncbi:opioid-binding protein/cell adhesion molecule homolog [Ruditapes philippinarum]|uniref:opioid-binding protein/cell adhesion molecule homolog n=1 Tax=Ruditapes philippinarum TaxID=129788 RepID=UPI00295C06EC|nr:opioid-binding protein/cell adhesion molecule homolog [Ruditapes philippinarum]
MIITACRTLRNAYVTMDISLNILVLFCFLKVFTAVYGARPSFIIPVTNITVVEGNTAMLPCAVKNLGDHKVIWTSPSRLLLTHMDRRIIDDTRYSVERPFSSDWNLRIQNVRSSDRGNYICQVNTNPVISTIVILDVKVPAQIRHDVSSRDVILKEGETLSLQCNATGIPQPTVKWYKLQSGHKQDINSSGGVLTIPNVTRKNAGTYECVAFNGWSDSRQIGVVIQIAPKVNIPYKRVGQSVGREVILDCEITADPLADMHWLKGNISLHNLNNDKYQTELYSSDTDNITKNLYLTIIHLQKDDFGNYTCFASNSIGTDYDTVKVYGKMFP